MNNKILPNKILKPCPFCGEELIVVPNGYYSHDRKENPDDYCFGAVWVFSIDDEKMIERWNMRAGGSR